LKNGALLKNWCGIGAEDTPRNPETIEDTRKMKES